MSWFKTERERKQFKDKLQELWDRCLSEFCTNLKKVAPGTILPTEQRSEKIFVTTSLEAGSIESP